MGSGPKDSDPLADTAAATPETLAQTAAASTASLGSGPSATRATLASGATLGRYVILRELGAGGMGTVYAARDPELARDVAIKILHAELSDQRARLLSEARTVAKLRHPNIITVYDVGTQGDVLFVAMELVEGTTLRTWLKARRSWDEILATFGQAARGLAAAHSAGIVHRDFKPDNVLLANDGRVVVTDFGLARVLEEHRDRSSTGDDVKLTQTGAVLGTPAYMSPEQFEGAIADARSDQFSFGVSLFEAAFGMSPFRGTAFDELRDNVLNGEPAAPPAGAVSPRVRTAILRSLARNPSDRFASIDVMLADLEPPRRRRRWVAVAIVGSLVAAVVAVAAVRVRPSGKARAPLIELAHEQPLARSSKDAIMLFLRDGRVLRADGNTLQLEELGGNVVARIPTPDNERAAAILGTGDSDVVMVASGRLPQCQWWRLQLSTRRADKLGTADECMRSVSFGYDGHRLAIAYGLAGLAVRDAASGASLWSKVMPAMNPVFSPDGRRIAVIGEGTVVVVDANTGDEIFRTRTNHCAWLDSNRLLYTAASTDSASRLAESVLELAQFSASDLRAVIARDEVVYHGSQRIITLAATNDAIIIGTEFGHRSLYVVPSAPNVPVQIDSARPETTGIVNDGRAAAWTRNGEVITEGKDLRDRAIYLKTKPGSHGSMLATLDASGFDGETATGDQIWYRVFLRSEQPVCAIGTVDIESGAVSEWQRGPCAKEPLLSCASAAPKCIAAEANGTGGSTWFDPSARQLGESAPKLDGILAPDGKTYASVDPDFRVRIHSIDAKELAAITPTPPFESSSGDVFFHSLRWMPDGHSLLVVIESRTNGAYKLVRLGLDGTWRALAVSSTFELSDPLPSRDGTQVALSASPLSYSWSLFPIVAIHDR